MKHVFNFFSKWNGAVGSYQRSLYSYKTIYRVVLAVLYIGFVLRYSMAFFSGELEEYHLIKKTIFLLLSTVIVALYIFRKVKTDHAVSALVYSFVISIMIETFFELDSTPDRFRAFFLRKEIFFFIFTYALGLLINIRHIVMVSLLNVFFVLICSFLMREAIPFLEFFFYLFAAIGTGLIGYRIHHFLNNVMVNLNLANQKIETQKKELQALNTSKDELFRILGHDLKSPLHQMTTLIYGVENAQDLEERKSYLDLMKSTVKNGNNLIHMVLKWADNQKCESETLKELVNLKSIVDEMKEFFSASFINKPVDVLDDIDEDVVVFADPNMLKTILRNLISNAIKYSHRNSQIKIFTTGMEERVKISVQDFGVGMSKKVADGLFKDEKVTSIQGTENEKGTGFGISICRKLIQNHRSKLEIKSEPGEGSVFSFTLLKSEN